MTPRSVPVEVDGPTVRLIKVAQGVAAAGFLPVATSRDLVRLARSVRLFAEARECGTAADICETIATLGVDGAAEYEQLEALLTRHTTPLIKNLRRHA